MKLFTPDADAGALIDAIAQVTDVDLRTGERLLNVLAFPLLTVPRHSAAAALEALRAVTSEPQHRPDSAPDWRTLDLGEALIAWGWSTRANPDGSVDIGGLYGDWTVPELFAALVAVAPHLRARSSVQEPMVFASSMFRREPAFALTFTEAGIEMSTEIEAEFQFRVF